MDIKTFEENVIKMAKMMWPGRNSYSTEQLNIVRAKLQSDIDLMEPPPPPKPKEVPVEAKVEEVDLKKEIKYTPPMVKVKPIVKPVAKRGRPKGK